MDQAVMEQVKGMSEEERREFLEKNQSELASDTLNKVNDDAADGEKKNPNSECPFEGNWESSFGFVCNGEEVC